MIGDDRKTSCRIKRFVFLLTTLMGNFSMICFFSILRTRLDDMRRVVMLRTSSHKRGIPFDDHCLICGKGLLSFCCFVQRGKACLSCEHLVCVDCRHALVFNDSEVFYVCMLCKMKRSVEEPSHVLCSVRMF